MEFNGNDRIDARVVRANEDATLHKGYATLVVMDGNGQEVEVSVSIAPWLCYLNATVLACAETPEQVYAGFHLITKHGVSKKDGSPKTYHNLLGIHGIEQPEDWQDQLEAMGLSRQWPKGNGRKAMPPPGAAGADLPGQTIIDDPMDLPSPEEEA